MPEASVVQPSQDDAKSSLRMIDAYERIRVAILEGAFPPGARLSQVKIAERLGLSRTPVREALRLIEKEGLVLSEPGRQVTISKTSMADLDELYALRVNLDTMTVRVTASELLDSDLAEMRDCLDEMEANESPDRFKEFDRAHRQFHMIAIRGAGARHAEYSAHLNEHAERYRRLYLVEANSYQQSKEEHKAIMEACVARDGELVARLLAEHYARIALTIIARIDPVFEPRLLRSAVRIALQSRSGLLRKDEAERRSATGWDGL